MVVGADDVGARETQRRVSTDERCTVDVFDAAVMLPAPSALKAPAMAKGPPESNAWNKNAYLPFNTPLLSGVIVTVEGPELLGAVTEVAVTVTVAGDGMTAGAG